jgi:hypothetical protein
VWGVSGPVKAASRPPAPTGPAPALGERRALPSAERRNGPDLALLLAGLVAVGVAYIAWRALAEPWVHVVVREAIEDAEPVVRADLTLRGDAAMVGSIAKALAGIVGALGILWLGYGLDRGRTMRLIASPTWGLLATIAGLGGAYLASSVWFVWKDATLAASGPRAAERLRELYAAIEPPLVDVSAQRGLTTFLTAMAAGLAASALGWWAYRKRG